MQWNPFKKKDGEDGKDDLPQIPGGPDPKDMNFMQRMAYKRFLKMSPEEQRKVMQKAMTPKNVEKHKDEILKSLEEMRKSGQMSDDQYRLAKAKLGLK